MHAYDLSPLFRSTVGFDRISQLLDAANKADDRSGGYPPYNIIRHNDDEYQIVMAVAGFSMDDLEIMVQENSLSVSGSIKQDDNHEDITYLHKGIATRNFERKFSLADHVKVMDATLDNGLLTLNLKREIPEESKPRMIAINGKTPKQIEAKSKK